MKQQFDRISTYPAPLRLGIFIVCLLLLWLPIALPLSLLLKNPNTEAIATMGCLFLVFLGLVNWWNEKLYHRSQPFKSYGLVWTRRNGIDTFNGLSTGFVVCWSLFILEGSLGWLEWQTSSVSLLKVAVEGFLSAMGIAVAEELVFRGWLLDELDRDYALPTVVRSNALIFALAHFLKPIAEVIRTWVTFPALVLLGLILVWAKQGNGDRLGVCIGLHAGLVWGYYILNVGQLIAFTNQVPSWVTGIDGNPIAGIMGLFCFSILAWYFNRTKARKYK